PPPARLVSQSSAEHPATGSAETGDPVRANGSFRADGPDPTRPTIRKPIPQHEPLLPALNKKRDPIRVPRKSTKRKGTDSCQATPAARRKIAPLSQNKSLRTRSRVPFFKAIPLCIQILLQHLFDAAQHLFPAQQGKGLVQVRAVGLSRDGRANRHEQLLPLISRFLLDPLQRLLDACRL